MKYLRKIIRELILETAGKSNAKTITDLIPGVHTIEVKGRPRGVAVNLIIDGKLGLRLNVVDRTGNPDILMVGAAYVEDSRADGFGPLIYDIAMEYTTKVLGKYLTADRSSCEPDAQRVWQFYKDNRIGQDGITAIPLDNHHNIVTPEPEDNVDTMMADDLYYQSKNYRFAQQNPGDEDLIQKVWYSRNGMMYGYKKEPEIIPALMGLDGVLTINKW